MVLDTTSKCHDATPVWIVIPPMRLCASAPLPDTGEVFSALPFFFFTDELKAKHQVKSQDTEMADRRATPHGGHP